VAFYLSWIPICVVLAIITHFILSCVGYAMLGRNMIAGDHPICKLDITKWYSVNLTHMSSKTGVFKIDGTEYIDIVKRGTVVGGYLSLIFGVISVLMLFVCLGVYVTSPVPPLPDQITGDLYLDSFQGREVSSVPYNAFGYNMGVALNQWIVGTDNLYVAEVLGGDWGTQCIDYELIRGKELDGVAQLIYSFSAGAVPPSINAPMPQPTTINDLRGALSVHTEGCSLAGSGAPCSDAYTYAREDAAVNNPVMAYGCFRDDSGVYHHLSMMSMNLVEYKPQGNTPHYQLSWGPTDALPQFGKTVAAVRLHVVPPVFEPMGTGTHDLLTTLISPAMKYETPDYIVCGWYKILGLTPLDVADISQAQLEQCTRPLQPMVPKGPQIYENSALFGTDHTRPGHWDHTREVYQSIGPLPYVEPVVPNPTHTCAFQCMDNDSQTCAYTGLCCDYFTTGKVLSEQEQAVYANEETANGPPAAVLCPSGQTFHIESELGYTIVEQTQFDNWRSDEVYIHYATSYNAVHNVDSSHCMAGSVEVTADNPFSIRIERKYNTDILVVAFATPSLMAILSAYVFLVVALFGCHAVIT
ncbi:hypothetical protein KIPB_010065, partial [Kipferlia bialata]